jgi:hypothetical protein
MGMARGLYQSQSRARPAALINSGKKKAQKSMHEEQYSIYLKQESGNLNGLGVTDNSGPGGEFFLIILLKTFSHDRVCSSTPSDWLSVSKNRIFFVLQEIVNAGYKS